jgi:adenine-specific DNA methylase
MTALECDFPIVEVSELGEQESWRKEINRPIYHIHKWWATRLGSVFRAITLGALSPATTDVWHDFYRQHHLSNKVVLDPFMGSGTTLGEALKLGAKAIGCDINPVSTFLVRQAFTRVPEADLRTAFAKLEATVAPEIRRYYQTQEPATAATGQTLQVLYYFWCKTVTTPDGETIPLLSRYVFAQDAYAKKKPRAQIICPGCWNVIEDRFDTTDLVCPHCTHRFNPQDGPADGQHVRDSTGQRHKIKDLLPADGSPPAHRLYALMALKGNGDKCYLPARPHDHMLFAEAEQRLRTEDLPLPTLAVRPGHNTDQARGYHYHHWRDFFNARQLLCLGLLLRGILEIEDHAVQEQMLCLFSSTLEFNNLFCSFKGEGTGSRKFTASAPLEAVRVDTWTELQATEGALMVLNGNSASLPLPDACVDAVVTDPPYFDFVHYSELSDFFYAWLSPVLGTRYPWMRKPDCSDRGEVQHKDHGVFARQLGCVLSECRRVLKDEGVLAFSFHHSRAEGWAAIHEAIATAGLTVVAAHPVHAELRAASPKTSARDPISLDAILVCKKRSEATQHASSTDSLPERVAHLIRRLESADLSVSRGDRFVIGASQLLIDAGTGQWDRDTVCKHLEAWRTECFMREAESC